jgi:hypothetical protein
VRFPAKMTCGQRNPPILRIDALTPYYRNSFARQSLRRNPDRLAHRLHLPGQNRMRLPIVGMACHRFVRFGRFEAVQAVRWFALFPAAYKTIRR